MPLNPVETDQLAHAWEDKHLFEGIFGRLREQSILDGSFRVGMPACVCFRGRPFHSLKASVLGSGWCPFASV